MVGQICLCRLISANEWFSYTLHWAATPRPWRRKSEKGGENVENVGGGSWKGKLDTATCRGFGQFKRRLPLSLSRRRMRLRLTQMFGFEAINEARKQAGAGENKRKSAAENKSEAVRCVPFCFFFSCSIFCSSIFRLVIKWQTYARAINNPRSEKHATGLFLRAHRKNHNVARTCCHKGAEEKGLGIAETPEPKGGATEQAT